MVITHYTLQTKDHKLAIREEDLTPQEFDIIRNSLKHYYLTLENSYEKMVNEGIDDISLSIKEKLEKVRNLRRKLDGRE